MNPVPQCHLDRWSMEAISPAITVVALEEFISIAYRYLDHPHTVFSADLLKELIKKHDIAKYKVNLLLSVGLKVVSGIASEYEVERARIWGDIEESTTYLGMQEQERDLNKDEKNEAVSNVAFKNGAAIDKQGSSAKGERLPPDPVVIRGAKRVVAKYQRTCTQEILKKDDDDLDMIEHSLACIDEKYKRARAVVKKAIDTATHPEDYQPEKDNNAQAESLLRRLRTIWLDARLYFVASSGELYDDSDMEEEYELGLL
ncbi:hypothetical protein F4803DRAFT_555741 [Xylaria telfairii]|nr:hypothetical protein F4803DRAFT_555741 [Xylaria telfairii]